MKHLANANFIRVITSTISMLVLSFVFAVVAMNWAMGCGQAFYYPDGTWKTGECLLIPHEQKSGVWFKPEPTAKATF